MKQKIKDVNNVANNLLDTSVPGTRDPVKTGVGLMSKIKSCASWLVSHAPASIKNTLTSLTGKAWEGVKKIIVGSYKTETPYVSTKSESVYKTEEPFVLAKSESALKNFVEQYTIDGRAGYDPKSRTKVKALVTDKLQTLRQTKVKMILKCVMQKNKYCYRRSHDY